MIFDFRVYVLIGLFMINCIALMIYNFVIIRRSKGQSTPAAGKIEKWQKILYLQTTIPYDSKASVLKHEKFLRKKLSNVENLLAYSYALQHLKNESLQAYKTYIQGHYATFQRLADIYSRKSRIERTCYADFICTFPEVAGDTHGQLVDTLISYIDDSSIHCRAKILRALCSIGSIHGVVNALQVIHEKSLFVHRQLLTNELSNFSGNKRVLGRHLWNESRHWNSSITASVEQFITQGSGGYSKVSKDLSGGTEARVA